MGLTLTQLVATRTKEEIRDELILALQGVGFVAKTGPGEGSISLSGVSETDATVVISIKTSGPLGSALFRYSLDGGATNNGSDLVVPSGGAYLLPGTGITVTFEAGPGEPSDSFLTGDAYTFELSTPTLPTTSWHPGSTVRTIIEKDAEILENYSLTAQRLAQSAFLSTASSGWLDLVLNEVYDIQRVPGQTAIHSVLLTDTASAGPYNITAGQLTAATATGLRFTNAVGGVIPQGGSVSLSFEAEQKGTQYNVGTGLINVLLTSLPGVSVSNTAITRHGVNRETDDAARARAKLRWPALGVGTPDAAYSLAATDASDSVTRVRVQADPAVPGNVLVRVAGPAGAVDSSIVATVQAAIDAVVPFGTTATVLSATAQNIAVVATAYVRTGYAAPALADIQANLTAFFQGGHNSIGEELEALPIGDGTQTVYQSELVEQVQIVTGVRNVVLTSPGDFVIANNSVAMLSPAPAITIVEV